MWISHRKEIRKLTFRWLIHIINPVDKTQLSRYTSHRRSFIFEHRIHALRYCILLENTKLRPQELYRQGAAQRSYYAEKSMANNLTVFVQIYQSFKTFT